MDVTLVRQHPAEITEADRATVRRVLCGIVDGLGEDDQRKWHRFLGRLTRLEPGQAVELRTHQERLGAYHRRHMLIEHRVFEAQERFEAFEQFRCWLKVGAGLCDWMPGPQGLVPIPRSIRYARMEQGDFERFHAAAIAFLRSTPALVALWPHLPALQALSTVETLLAEFDE